MNRYKVGTVAPQTGLYWCTVCKTPAKFQQGETFPQCRNMCGKGFWEFVENA